MEQDEPAAALYDFLYRDSGRITSYYAQVFGSHLSSIEETHGEQKGKEFSGKLDAKIVSGDAKSTSGLQVTTKRVSDPHDIVTTDVLAYLTENGRVETDVESAPHGALILVKGTVVFIDSSMGELATIAFKEHVRTEQAKPKTQQNTAANQTNKLTISLLEKLNFPSAFLLGTDSGANAVGFIKDAGMEEPIPSYYFKHGASGLTDVYLIGIKEVPTSNFALPETQLIGIVQHVAQAMSDMMFPPDAIRVTPIALFRSLP